MLGEAQPVAFLATARPAEARWFYERILGLTFVEEDEFALVFDLGPVRLRIARVAAVEPASRTVLGWDVEDAAAVAAALEAAGVALERYGGFEQDDAGLWRAPGGALVGWFRDPDGNLLSITQQAAASA